MAAGHNVIRTDHHLIKMTVWVEPAATSPVIPTPEYWPHYSTRQRQPAPRLELLSCEFWTCQLVWSFKCCPYRTPMPAALPAPSSPSFSAMLVHYFISMWGSRVGREVWNYTGAFVELWTRQHTKGEKKAMLFFKKNKQRKKNKTFWAVFKAIWGTWSKYILGMPTSVLLVA